MLACYQADARASKIESLSPDYHSIDMSLAWGSNDDIFRETLVRDFQEFDLSYVIPIPLYYIYTSPLHENCG